jgi:hypothetical protein
MNKLNAYNKVKDIFGMGKNQCRKFGFPSKLYTVGRSEAIY